VIWWHGVKGRKLSRGEKMPSADAVSVRSGAKSVRSGVARSHVSGSRSSTTSREGSSGSGSLLGQPTLACGKEQRMMGECVCGRPVRVSGLDMKELQKKEALARATEDPDEIKKAEAYAIDASAKMCDCPGRRPVPNIYNKEVYTALQSRGGAVWERLHLEKHAAKDANPETGQTSWGDVHGVKASAGVDYNEVFNLKDKKDKITKPFLDCVTKMIERIISQADKDGKTLFTVTWVEADEGGWDKMTAMFTEGLEKEKIADASQELQVYDGARKLLSHGDSMESWWQTIKALQKESFPVEVCDNRGKIACIGKSKFVDACLAGGIPSAFGRKDLETMFDAVDVSKNGLIDVPEWLQAVAGKIGK